MNNVSFPVPVAAIYSIRLLVRLHVFFLGFIPSIVCINLRIIHLSLQVKDARRCSPRTILFTFLNHDEHSNDNAFYVCQYFF